MSTGESKVKSLEKAMCILDCFTVTQSELGITQLSEMLGMNKSNVHNIITTFVHHGFIEKLPNGKYTLGLKMLEYAFIINQHLGYPKAVYDILVNVAAQTDEIVYFGLPRGTDVLYLYVVHPTSKMNILPYRDMLGEKAPLYCTGIGKSMLAFMPQEEWLDRIPRKREQYTPATITDYDEIVSDLERTRKRGYSIDNEGRDLDVRCVGVPIFNTRNQLVAGMSTSGPKGTMTDEKVHRCSLILMDAAMHMRERIYN